MALKPWYKVVTPREDLREPPSRLAWGARAEGEHGDDEGNLPEDEPALQE